MAESRPSGASVAAGEQLLGQTPLFIELEPARYTLTLRRPGYHDWVGYTQVQYAETVPVLALLDRIKTRKLPLLLAGAVAGVGAGFAAYRGEAEYRNYQAATTEEESERLKASVQTWDWTRNAGAAAALLSVTLYLTLKW
jgi:hypothetical protein